MVSGRSTEDWRGGMGGGLEGEARGTTAGALQSDRLVNISEHAIQKVRGRQYSRKKVEP